MTGPKQQDFLARWSRRKRAQAEPDLEPTPAAPEGAVPDAVEDAPGKTDAELLEELGLPDPDRLSAGDDFSAFMAKAVPARLRNRALRRLWTSNPVLANLDELVDYGEDFTDSATVIESLATAWQTGKGYVLADPQPSASDDDEAPDAPDQPAASEPEPEPEPEPEHGVDRAPADDAPASGELSQVGASASASTALRGDMPQTSDGSAEAASAGSAPAVRPRRMRFELPDSGA